MKRSLATLVMPAAIAAGCVPARSSTYEIGSRVQIETTVHSHANDVAFLVDVEGEPMLLVQRRDTRDDARRQRGEPPAHGIAPLQAGQHVRISASVQPLPRAEEMYSWNLTPPEQAVAARERVYLHAHEITAATPN